MRLSSSLLLCALAALPVAPARAGASLWGDDAAITPAGQCQVESWWRAASRDAELTTAPACAWGSTEPGLALSRGLGNGASAFAAGIKQSLRDPGQGRWGAALSLDATWQARTSRYAGSTLNLPSSVGLDPQRRTLLQSTWAGRRRATAPVTRMRAWAWNVPPAATGTGWPGP